MKISFPHLGSTFLAAKAFFDGMGIECVVPPLSSKEALDIGIEYSPEEMCLPFKIMLGNYIQSIKMGADTIIITGSCGPCRYGEYCELQINILKKLGYNLNLIVLDNPFTIGKNEFMKRINYISSASRKSSNEKIKALFCTYKIINLIDKIEADLKYKAGYEVKKGQCKKLLYEYRREAIKCSNPYDMLKLLRNYHKKVRDIAVDRSKKPLKISIMGEIYTIIEPFSNLYIEEKLMDYGVCTKRTLTPSWWFKDLILSAIKLNSLNIRYSSREYLPLYIGGHARECIGEAVISSREGMDGAIQIFPMGCMPEIVSKSILPSISKDKDFPIMTLIVDEMTGEGGFVTRIEAFLDLLERRKGNVLSRC